MGADPVITQAWRDYAMAEANAQLQASPGFRMTNMMTQMMTMWTNHVKQTYEEDKQAMDKFVPQEGDVMNVMKDFTPAAQAKMVGAIGDMRKEMFKAMRANDKQKVSEYWGKINSVTDQLKMFNEGIASHKKNHDEGNYSAASNHFDMAQFTTGKYGLEFDPESGQVMLAMFERDDKKPILVTADQFGRSTMVKQHEAADDLNKQIKTWYNEAVTFEDFDFDNFKEKAESYVERLVQKNDVMASFAHDDLVGNGGKNAVWKIKENEAQMRKNQELKGMPYIPQDNSWMDPMSNNYNPDRLREHVIGHDYDKDGNKTGNYTEGGLLHHIESEFNRMTGHYKRKMQKKENQTREMQTENFTMHKGLTGGAESSQLGVKKNIDMHISQVRSIGQKIESGKTFPYAGHQFVPSGNKDANGWSMWLHPITGDEITSEALIYVLDDNQGSFTLMPGIFGKFEKPRL